MKLNFSSIQNKLPFKRKLVERVVVKRRRPPTLIHSSPGSGCIMTWRQHWLPYWMTFWGRPMGKMSLLVFLNRSAAFDTIDHSILLGRLSGLEIGDLALSWLRFFLDSHHQILLLGEMMSAPWTLNCGVTQGLIISPLAFNVYMRSLEEVIRCFGTLCHQYVDDT